VIDTCSTGGSRGPRELPCLAATAFDGSTGSATTAFSDSDKGKKHQCSQATAVTNTAATNRSAWTTTTKGQRKHCCKNRQHDLVTSKAPQECNNLYIVPNRKHGASISTAPNNPHCTLYFNMSVNRTMLGPSDFFPSWPHEKHPQDCNHLYIVPNLKKLTLTG
jgi:hypothetical protein